MSFLGIHTIMLDEGLLLGAGTSLNLQLSSPNFDATPHSGNKWINNKYYMSADYLPSGSGPTLWTPLLCFL